MTKDQWMAIYVELEPTFHEVLATINPKDHCSLVAFLHDQKDALVEATIRVQRHNIRKHIDQQELPLEHDLFEDSNRSVGSNGSSGKD